MFGVSFSYLSNPIRENLKLGCTFVWQPLDLHYNFTCTSVWLSLNVRDNVVIAEPRSGIFGTSSAISSYYFFSLNTVCFIISWWSLANFFFIRIIKRYLVRKPTEYSPLAKKLLSEKRKERWCGPWEDFKVKQRKLVLQKSSFREDDESNADKTEVERKRLDHRLITIGSPF